MTQHYLSPRDLVFYKGEDGKIESGGFTVESILLQNRMNSSSQHDNTHISSSSPQLLFKEHGVPSGLCYQTVSKCVHRNGVECYDSEESYERNDKVLDDDIFNTLIKMVEVSERDMKRKTRREANCVKSKQRKTRKLIFM